MKYSKPKLHFISASKVDASCVDGSSAGGTNTCTFGPQAGAIVCRSGSAAAFFCRTGVAAGGRCRWGNDVGLTCSIGSIASNG